MAPSCDAVPTRKVAGPLAVCRVGSEKVCRVGSGPLAGWGLGPLAGWDLGPCAEWGLRPCAGWGLKPQRGPCTYGTEIRWLPCTLNGLVTDGRALITGHL